MNFRREILERIIQLLQTLVLPKDDKGNILPEHIRQGPTSDIEYLIPPVDPSTDARNECPGVLKGIEIGPLEQLPVSNPNQTPAPRAYVSFDGGRNDFGDTLLSHIVETVAIRIEVHLSEKIGIRWRNSGGEEQVRPIDFQGSDLLCDINRLINRTSLMTAVHSDPDVTVQDAIVEEWEFDDEFRGGDEEVLIVIVQVEVANTKEQ